MQSVLVYFVFLLPLGFPLVSAGPARDSRGGFTRLCQPVSLSREVVWWDPPNGASQLPWYLLAWEKKSQSHTAMRLPELGHLLQLDSSCRLCLPASVSLGRDGELLAWKGRRVFPLDAYYWQGSWLTLLCQLCQASLVFSEKVPLDLREKWTYLGFLLLPSWGSDNTRYEWSSVGGGGGI